MNTGNELVPSTARDTGRELATATAASAARYELESAITIAVRNPRHEDNSRAALMVSCRRSTFAEKSMYSFPRGGKTVAGPSVHMARECGRVWGNVRYGFEIIREDDETVQIRAFAWDMQTNTKVTQDATFARKIQRVDKATKETKWVTPDERDMRELVNRHGAIAERNCILKIVPPDLIEDAMEEVRRTRMGDVKADPDAARKKVIGAFAALNVSPSELEAYLGCPLRQITATQIDNLRAIHASIRDGATTWASYVQGDDEVVDATPTAAKRPTYSERRTKPASQTPPAVNEDAEPTDEEIAAIEAQAARES